MAGQGVFQVDRGIFDHPIFAPEPYTEREAWLWMLSSAAWADKRVRVGKSMFDLKRGQLAFATRFLAVKWRWAHSRVVRFINRLKSDTMVTTLATREATLITICNYNEYQFGRNADETPSGTPTGTEVKRARNKEEELKKDKNKEVSKKETRVVALLSGQESTWFETFWFMWPHKVGKPAALKAFGSAMGRAESLEAILAGVENYIRDKPPDRQWLNPATFLNQNRWEDLPATVSATNGTSKIQSGGSILAAIDRELEKSKQEDADLAAPTYPVLCISN